VRYNILFKNKKVLVTGGRTGFLGVNFVKELLDRGSIVYATSLEPKKLSLLKSHPKLIEYICDLRDDSIPDNIDYVIHCAAHTSGAKEIVGNPAAQVLPNIQLNSNLLHSAASSGVEKFVFISSSAVYPETDIAVIEDMGFERDPADIYFGVGWMKRYTEKLAEFYHKKYGMQVLIIRPSNIYGPYCNFDLDRAHVLPALIRKFIESKETVEVWGSPNVTRDFIFIDDFVTGTLLVFENLIDFDVYNIASGNTYTIDEAVNLISKLTNFKGKILYDDRKPMTIFKRVIDTSRAKSILGFKASTTFEEGLKKTIDYYKGLNICK
jgi:GDP-L-fucose synthase